MGDDRLLAGAPVASLDDWLAGDGGLGYAHALELGAEAVIAEVDRAGLRGRGGAGFPTARKWRGVIDEARRAASPIYLVANGAEGEPGTYKDRTLLEQNPYALLEGVLIAAFATGAQQAFVAVKHSFDRPLSRLRGALAEVVAAGWRGADHIEIVEGPSDYLFGEETGMLEVIEGKLPLPRLVRPFEQGLFATTTQPNPTVVNNVETLSHVTAILANGADWFRETGTADAPGTTLVTVVGDVDQPGVYELPLGTPLRTAIVDIAGAEQPKAVYSGTSNAVITADQLDTPMTYDAMQSAGTGLGSAGYVVYGQQRCMVRVLATLSRFLAAESCGQCNACKLGTAAITDVLDRIDAGDGTASDLDALLTRATRVTDQNRCYLPVGEQAMVLSTVQRFEGEFRDHLGTPCPSAGDVPVPLIAHLDDADGHVAYRWAHGIELGVVDDHGRRRAAT